MRAFLVHALRVGLDHVACHISGDIENTLVVLDGVLIVDRRIIKLVFVYVAALLELNDTSHQRIVQVELNLWMFCIIVCHNCCC